jgi:hypothetical protein
MLEDLVIAAPILEWLSATVLNADMTERAARESTLKGLQARHDRLEARIDTMYADKLDGPISQEYFDRNSAVWRTEQQSLMQKVRGIQMADPIPIDESINMLRLVSQTSELFVQQPSLEQRRFLQLVIERATWIGGELSTTMFEPFEVLRHSNHESRRKYKDDYLAGCDLDIWLPDMDSNHD